MKSLRYLGPGVLEVQELAKPAPAPGEVLLRVRACGICGSDVHGYLGLTGRRTPPMTMGHEFAGEVEAVGAGVTRLQPGDRVAPYPVDFCGVCELCQSGKGHLCAAKRQFGVLTVDGAFAEYICVPERLCFPIADGVSYEEASLMEPLAVAYHAVSRAGSLAGKTVMIVGAGTIGLLALQCVLLQNPAAVIVSDLSEGRLAVARRMDATHTVNPADAGAAEAIRSASGGSGVDVAFEAVGAGASVRSAMDALRFGGMAVWIGNNKPMIELNMQTVVTRELDIRGSFLYSLSDFEIVVGLLNRRALDVSPILSCEIGLEEAPQYFKQLAEAPGDLIKVVVKP